MERLELLRTLLDIEERVLVHFKSSILSATEVRAMILRHLIREEEAKVAALASILPEEEKP